VAKASDLEVWSWVHPMKGFFFCFCKRKSLDELSSKGSPESEQASQLKERFQIIHQRYPRIVVRVVEPTTLRINFSKS